MRCRLWSYFRTESVWDTTTSQHMLLMYCPTNIAGRNHIKNKGKSTNIRWNKKSQCIQRPRWCGVSTNVTTDLQNRQLQQLTLHLHTSLKSSLWLSFPHSHFFIIFGFSDVPHISKKMQGQCQSHSLCVTARQTAILWTTCRPAHWDIWFPLQVAKQISHMPLNTSAHTHTHTHTHLR